MWEAYLPAVLRFLEKGTGHEQKHHGLIHPFVVTSLFHVVMLSTGLATDYFVSAVVGGSQQSTGHAQLTFARISCALVLFCYWVLLLSLRFIIDRDKRGAVVYNLMFCCNVTLPLAAIAVLLQRPALLCAQGMLVAIDQVLWYVDLAGYFMVGKPPLGVVGYLFWPSTTLSQKVTCVHHVLFEPLVICICMSQSGIPLGQGFLVSAVQSIVCQAFCRYTTPLELVGKDDKRHYLNLNCCHEAFRDLKGDWLHRYDGAPKRVYFPALLAFWNFGNLSLFTVLAGILLAPLRLNGVEGAYLRF